MKQSLKLLVSRNQNVGKRTLFTMMPAFTGTVKHHEERILLKFSDKQIFDVVMDVDKYSKFVPWCQSSKVTRKTNNQMSADLQVGYPPFIEKYSSEITFVSPRQVHIISKDTALLEYLNTEWNFHPGYAPKTCWVHFKIDFRFKSAIYNEVSTIFLNEIVEHMVKAFDKRCREVYGIQ